MEVSGEHTVDDGVAIERRKSLTEQVFDRLMNSIVAGDFPFGTLLSEKVLAAEYGISKTPVREAFVQLQSIGLVEVLPQRGCLVFSANHQTSSRPMRSSHRA